MIPRVSIAEGISAGCVSSDHSSNGAGFRTRGVRSEAATVPGQCFVQTGTGHSRFHRDRIRGDLEDLLEPDAQIEHDCRAEAFPGQSSSGSARDDRDGVAEAILDQSDDIRRVLRDGDGQRHDLERAGIGGVKASGEGIEAQGTPKLPAKLLGDLLRVKHDGRKPVASGQTQDRERVQ